MLIFHSLPYVLAICAAGGSALWSLTDQAESWSRFAFVTLSGIAFGFAVFGFCFLIANGIAAGIAGGIAGGIAAGIGLGFFFFEIAPGLDGYEADSGTAGGIAFGIVLGIALGIAVGIALGIAFGMAVGIAHGIWFGIFFGILFGIFGIAVGIAVGIAFGIASTRVFYLIPHPIFFWPQPKPEIYRLHPVAWDDLCWIPFPRLDLLLAAVAETEPEFALAEIDRLISEYPSQKRQALRARTRLVARQAARESDLSRLDLVTASLPEGQKGFLSETNEIRRLIAEIAALQRRLDAADRPMFREPIAGNVRTTIENFRHRVAGFHEPLVSEFRRAADKWIMIADRQLAATQRALQTEPTPQVFRAGDPVDLTREAFVVRSAVVGELERQIMLAGGCPGLLLYGRRRVGKSTLIRNLTGFLPASVRVASLSMQDPDAFLSMESWAGVVTRTVREAIPGWKNGPESHQKLIGLYRFLNESNAHLEANEQRLLLAIDEYEFMDRKLAEGVFSEDLLATLRESIQNHRRITWIFVGSHEIAELKHAPWSSYLVSARTVEVPPFSPAETRLLLTEPLRHSPLWRKEDKGRPGFEPGFWGEDGIERIRTEAAGWPHLVQLLAETLVDLVNDSEATRVTSELFEQGLAKAIVRGDAVLRQLMEGEPQFAVEGEWQYLSRFMRVDAQPPPEDDAVFRSLRRRQLVEPENGQWRLRVPLMRRWLRERA